MASSSPASDCTGQAALVSVLSFRPALHLEEPVTQVISERGRNQYPFELQNVQVIETCLEVALQGEDVSVHKTVP